MQFWGGKQAYLYFDVPAFCDVFLHEDGSISKERTAAGRNCFEILCELFGRSADQQTESAAARRAFQHDLECRGGGVEVSGTTIG